MPLIENPYQPPAAEVADEIIYVWAAPWQHALACHLLWISLAVCAAGFLPVLSPSLWQQVSSTKSELARLIVYFVLVCGTQAVLFWMIRQGRRWALWLMTLVAMIFGLLMVQKFIRHGGITSAIQSMEILWSFLQSGAVGLLWSRPSRAWFRGEDPVN